MPELLRLRRTVRIGRVVVNGAAVVRSCCHRLVPVVRIEARRAGALGETAVRVSAAALAPCRRSR
jgi:hypothetical protein